jgi:predicted transcriptional regulator
MGANPIAIKLDAETKQRLEKLAEAKKRTPHYLMKEAVKDYVEREERAEELRKETLERWDAYTTSGEHVNNEAVMAWLDTWGREGEAERPSCEK